MPRSRSALYLWTDPSRSSADVARGLMRTNVCIAANLIKVCLHEAICSKQRHSTKCSDVYSSTSCRLRFIKRSKSFTYMLLSTNHMQFEFLLVPSKHFVEWCCLLQIASCKHTFRFYCQNGSYGFYSIMMIYQFN